MREKIFNTIKRHQMLSGSENIIVALSGGADSMSLLHFLLQNKNILGVGLEAAHVNHNIRGAEALRDENFVRGYCEANGVKLTVFSRDIPREAAENGESLEECGRRVRYELLRSIDGASIIATAHNLDDSAETALFNLTRGTGLKGLCGVPPKGERLIRPLIDCEKREILEYCSLYNLPYVTDSTNADTSYARNKVRGGVIPVLTEINPSFLTAFRRASEILSGYEEYLALEAEKIADEAVCGDKYRTAPLLDAHFALRGRALGLIVLRLTGIVCEQRHIAEIENILRPGGSVNIPGGKIIRSDGLFIFEQKIINRRDGRLLDLGHCDGLKPAPGGEEGSLVQQVFEVGARESKIIPVNDQNLLYKINNKIIKFEIKAFKGNKSQKFNNKLFINLLDYDKINGNAFIRTRAEGDSVRLHGRPYTKSLKKLFSEAAIPLCERDGIIVLADNSGILWVEGFGAADRCRVSEGTRKTMEPVVINSEFGERNSELL